MDTSRSIPANLRRPASESLLRWCLRQSPGRFALAVALLACGTALAAGAALLCAPLVDQAIVPGRPDLLILLLGGQLACLLARAVLTSGAFALFARHGADLAARLMLRVYAHFQRQSLRFHLERGQGELLQVLLRDVSCLEAGFSQWAGHALVSALQIVLVLGLLALCQPALAGLGVLGLLAVGWLSYKAGKLSERALESEVQAATRLAEHVLQTVGLRGVFLLTSAARDWALQTFRGRVADYSKNLVRRRVGPFCMLEGILGIGCVVQFVFYLAAGWLVIQQQLSLGDLAAIAVLLTYLTGGAEQLAGALVGLWEGWSRLRRVEEELAVREPTPDPSLPAPARPVRGDFHFHEVTVRYPGCRNALCSLSADIPAGAVTAVLGRSGAGKTTLAHLLLRLIEPDAGAITLDGDPLSRLPLDDYRRQVAFVPQETIFFRGSLRDNLLLGREADDAELARACRAARILPRIQSDRDGFDADMGEAGFRFSAGERQRLALARALLSRPRVLILDEPTAHLDGVNERLLLHTLQELAAAGATVVILAHHLPAWFSADHVVVVEEGRLVAEDSLVGQAF